MLRRIALFLICCSLAGFAQTKRPFTFEDMMQLKRIGEPIVSPDGKWVAFSAVDVNLEANTKTPHLWIVPISGGDAQASDTGERFGRRPPSFLRPMASACCSSRRKMAARRSRCRTSTQRTVSLDRRREEGDEHLDRSFRRDVVARRQEHSVRVVGLARLQRRRLQQGEGRREGQVEGEGEDLHAADVSSLDQLLRRQVQPPVPGLGRRRGCARSDAWRARRSAVLARRSGPVFVLARRQRDRVHQQHR